MPASTVEFRDIRPWVQYALGGIAGGGLVATVGCLRMVWAGEPVFNYLAISVALLAVVALAVVYFKFGKSSILRQLEDGLLLENGNDECWLPFSDLDGFATNWTDIHRNGVYSHTTVRFDFYSCGEELPAHKYSSSAGYGSAKYENLQTFQNDMARIIARQMLATLQAGGNVSWTPQITITHDALEIAGKSGSKPTVIQFSEITRWQVDQGLFKLAADGERKPSLVEKTSQYNFFPGLVLFDQITDIEPEIDRSKVKRTFWHTIDPVAIELTTCCQSA